MDAALKYLSPKARTAREVETYLDGCQYSEYDVYAVVERLKELGYVDDAKYAEAFIESRLAAKAVSKRKLREQLLAHGIERDIADEALKTVSDEDEYGNVLEIARKFYEQFSALDVQERITRTIRRLIARGYSYDDAKRAVRQLADAAESDFDE